MARLTSKERLQRSTEQSISKHVFPGCVIGIVRSDGKGEIWPFGHLTYETGAPDVETNTIYDVASITKSIPTASLALTLIAEGKLSLGGLVREYLPELQNDHNATIEDLLRYRVHGPRMAHLKYQTIEEIRTHIFERGFDGPPGESSYTNLPAFLLGLVVEKVGGTILPALADRYFFEPLGMTDTTFLLAAPYPPIVYGREGLGDIKNISVLENVAPTEVVDGEEIRGIVHDESARVFARERRAVGHAGLFSTVPDLLKFAEALLNGTLNVVAEGAEQGLGWPLDEPWRVGRYGRKMFSKTGFTGTLIVVDRERGTAFVILSNRTYPKRPPDNAAINQFRADVADIVFGNG